MGITTVSNPDDVAELKVEPIAVLREASFLVHGGSLGLLQGGVSSQGISPQRERGERRQINNHEPHFLAGSEQRRLGNVIYEHAKKYVKRIFLVAGARLFSWNSHVAGQAIEADRQKH